MRIRPVFALFGFIFLAATLPLMAQEESEGGAEDAGLQKWHAYVDGLSWTEGPSDVKIGRRGTIALPSNLRAVGEKEARDLVENMGNPRGTQLALLAPKEGIDWFIDFEFSDDGYVKDDEKDEVADKADDLLESLREGQEIGNKMRESKGLDTLTIRGWAHKPEYDAELNALVWATDLESSSGGRSINHNIRLLGRRGIMNAVLVCDPETYREVKGTAREIVKAYRYVDGERYSDFEEGDKIAEYGLAALIAGGGFAFAAKAGLFKKFWKLIVGGVVAVGAFLKRLFGGGKSDDGEDR